MKKCLCLLLALVFLLSMAACGGDSGEGTQAPDSSETQQGSAGNPETAGPGTGEAPVEIVFGMYTGAEYPDMAMVSEAVSEYTLENYNFTVNTLPLIAPTYSDTVMLMMMGQEQLDLFHNGAMGQFDLVNWSTQGMLADLTDLLAEYGQGVTEALGDYINSGYVGGQLTFVPRLAEMAKAQGFIFNKQMIEDANIDLSAVKTLEDMTPVLAALKEAYPTVAPIGVAASSETISRFFLQIDNLGNDVSGVLLNNGQDEDLKIVNLYETDIYRDTIALVNEWYKAGYIIADVDTTQDEAQSLVGAGRIVGYPYDLKPGIEQQDSGRAGVEVVSVQLTPAVAATSSICNFGFSITSYSNYKVQAMQLLNLLFSDEYVHNLYCYGIEGVHWQWTDDSHTFITFADGLDAATSGYYPSSNFLYGDISISYLWEGNEETLYEDTREWANEALISAGAGFSFDPSNVEAEYAAITSIYTQYAKSLGNGTAPDWEATLEQFNQQLYSAGLQTVLDEKQRQFDEWYAANHAA